MYRDRRTAAERYTQLAPLIPGNDLTSGEIAQRGLSHLIKLGVTSLGADRPLVTMQELGDRFMSTASGVNYKSKVDALVTELGSSTVVESLTYPILRTWHDRQHRAITTRNHYVDILAMMIKGGLRDGVLWHNPLTNVKKLLITPVELPEAEILSVDQVATIMNFATSIRRDATDVLALILFGGLETGAAARLRYEDVTDAIHVPGELTINCHRWTLPCPPNLQAWLRAGGAKSGPITRITDKSMGRVITEIFATAGMPRPKDIHYTWAAHRRAVVGDIAEVYAGRFLTKFTTPEDRTPVVARAEGIRYFDIYPLAAGTNAQDPTIIPWQPANPS